MSVQIERTNARAREGCKKPKKRTRPPRGPQLAEKNAPQNGNKKPLLHHGRVSDDKLVLVRRWCLFFLFTALICLINAVTRIAPDDKSVIGCVIEPYSLSLLVAFPYAPLVAVKIWPSPPHRGGEAGEWLVCCCTNMCNF